MGGERVISSITRRGNMFVGYHTLFTRDTNSSIIACSRYKHVVGHRTGSFVKALQER